MRGHVRPSYNDLVRGTFGPCHIVLRWLLTTFAAHVFAVEPNDDRNHCRSEGLEHNIGSCKRAYSRRGFRSFLQADVSASAPVILSESSSDVGDVDASSANVEFRPTPDAMKEAAVADDVNTQFDAFKRSHAKEYVSGTREHELRRALFVRRVAEVNDFNQHGFREGAFTRPPRRRLWTAGINALSDRNPEELRRLHGWRGFLGGGSSGGLTTAPMSPSFFQVATVSKLNSWGVGKAYPQDDETAGQVDSFPVEKSWADLNATRLGREQGACGSCWAVATASVLQAHVEIHRPGLKRRLSAQELVSCVSNPLHCGGSGGCAGATAELAMDYALRHGLGEEAANAPVPKDLPCSAAPPVAAVKAMGAAVDVVAAVQANVATADDVTADAAEAAIRSSSSRFFGLHGWERLPSNREAPLLRALVERGPMVVAVSATNWYNYASGIFDACPADAVIDHAVSLIGYGVDIDFGEPYWQILNSWSSTWGERGKMRLLRGSGGEPAATQSPLEDDAHAPVDRGLQCGIDRHPELGTACEKSGKVVKEVRVCGMCGILYNAVVPHF